MSKGGRELKVVENVYEETRGGRIGGTTNILVLAFLSGGVEIPNDYHVRHD